MVVVIVAQTLSTLLSGVSAELGATAAIFNAAAAFSTYLVFRRPDRSRWPLVIWAAGFFGWHVTGLATLAGIVTTNLDPVFVIASQRELSILYQTVLAVLAGFAVHLLLPRPEKA